MKTTEIMARLQAKYPIEKEYLQAVQEVLESIEEVYNQHPEFEKAKIVERLVEPDRIFTFRVTWIDENGEVHVGTAEIINVSTGEVVVSSVSISTRNGWQIVPYTTDMAHEKVDAQLLGFKINGAQTTKNGNAETFALSAPWEIAENSRLPLSYDAVVSAVCFCKGVCNSH